MAIPALANQKCKSEIIGYKVLKESVYPFIIDKKKACFFAFRTANPNPMIDTKGDGNLGDSLWYGYYLKKAPSKIYEFPKPSSNDWSDVCNISAISFYPMHGGQKRDVTVIGTCHNAYSYPFVFIWQDGKFILDEDVFTSLYAVIALTISDIREYIKSPDTLYKSLRDRSNWQS
jgi:hypothetical protein